MNDIAAEPPRPRAKRYVVAVIGVLALVGAGAAVWLSRRGGEAELAACSDRAWVERATTAIGKLQLRHPFVPAWTKLRDELCQLPAGERPANAGARLRCIDGRARELVALEREHPARIAAYWSFMVPYECAGEHAASLAALEPDEEHLGEVVRIRLTLAEEHPALDALDGAVHASGFAPLVQEVALRRAIEAVDAQPLRDVAAVAEHTGHVMVAAHARLALVLRALSENEDKARVRELLAASDAAIAAAGDPPNLRARWFAVQSFDARSRSDEKRVREATARAEQLIDRYQIPVDARLIDDLAASYTWLGNLEQAMTYYKRAVDLARSGTATDQLIALTNYGLALCDVDKIDESLATLAPAIQIAERGTFAPPERAFTLVQYARAANTGGKYALALETLDGWSNAIAKLREGSLMRGRLAYERAVALMGTGKLDDAAGEVRHAIAIFTGKLGAQSSLTGDAEIFAGQIAYQQHAYDDARQKLERGIADMIAVDGDEAPRVAQGRVWLAKTLLELGDREHARPVIERALAVWSKLGVGEDDYLDAEVVRARLLPEAERTQAIATLERALAVWRKDPASWKAEIAEVEAQLVAWKRHE